MTVSLGTAYRSFGGEVEASNPPTICRLHRFMPSPTLGHSSPVAQAEALDQPAQRRQRPLLPLRRLHPALPRPASPTPPGTRNATTLTRTRRPACCQALRPLSRGPVLHLGPTISA